jgi:hypothetical protein
VFDGGIHVQPLQFRLFARNDHIDVIAASQAMVGDGEQGVGVRRQIYADDSAPRSLLYFSEGRALAKNGYTHFDLSQWQVG